MGFIHGQMLPPGKTVLVQIPRQRTDSLIVLAQVAHCRHVEGMVHEVGLKFLASRSSGQSAPDATSLRPQA